MSQTTSPLSSSASNAPSLQKQKSFTVQYSPTTPDKVAQLRGVILFAARAEQEKYEEIKKAFYNYKTPDKNETKEEDSAALINNSVKLETRMLETSIEEYRVAIKTKNNLSEAKNNLLNAFAAFEEKLKEKEKNTTEFKKLKTVLSFLELNEADRIRYQAIGEALRSLNEEVESLKKLEIAYNIATLNKTTRLRNEIKKLELRKNSSRENWLYLGILLASGSAIIASFFTLPLTTFLLAALPWTLLAGGLLAAANYSLHAFNSKVTTGRGIAVAIALTTAVLAYAGATGANIAIPFAILIASGCFLANLILYRANVPQVINDLTIYLKKSLRSFKWKDIISLEAAKKTSLILAAIITGFILTVGMWHSWMFTFGTFSIASVLLAPYIFYPLMIVALVANTAFVYRSIYRASQLLSDALSIYKNGLVSVEDQEQACTYYKMASEDGSQAKYTIHTKMSAVCIHFFDIKPADNTRTVIGKVFFHLFVKLAVVALIAVLSQKALIGMSISSLPEVLPWIKNAALGITTTLGLVIGTASRVSFVILDLFTNLSKLTNFILDKKERAKLVVSIREFFSKEVWSESYTQLAKAQTQNWHLLEVWRATGLDDWKKIWQMQVDEDWRRTPSFIQNYYYIKAIAIMVMRLFTVPAIFLNTIANAFISIYKGGNGEGLNATPVTASVGGASSAGLVFFSASNLERERAELLNPEVTIKEPRLIKPEPEQDKQSPSASRPLSVVTEGLPPPSTPSLYSLFTLTATARNIPRASNASASPAENSGSGNEASNASASPAENSGRGAKASNTSHGLFLSPLPRDSEGSTKGGAKVEEGRPHAGALYRVSS